MDREQIKKALNSFENDKYVDAKEIISKEIAGQRDVFLKNKLGLTLDINPTPKVDTDDNKGVDDNKGDE